METFKPEQFKSYEELPEEKKPLFHAIEEGKGFVLKSVEKNPTTANHLAIIEDEAIGLLKQKIEYSGTSLDDALSLYEDAANKSNYDQKHTAKKYIAQFADLESLRGKQIDPRVNELFKKHYESLNYSDTTEESFVRNLSIGDESTVVKILQDEKFVSQYRLIRKMKEFGSDESLRSIYKQSEGDTKITHLIIQAVDGADLKQEIFKDTIDSIKNIEDPKLKNEKLKDYHIKAIKEEVVSTLVKSGSFNVLKELVRDNDLEAEDIKKFAHAISSDEFLFDLCRSMKDEKSIIYMFKFIANKDVFAEIINNNGAQFDVDDTIKGRVVDSARVFLGALSADPGIKQMDDLHLTDDKDVGTNKFVVGVPLDENKFYMAWSNTDSHEYHKDIFKSLESTADKKFPESLRSGGYIDIQEKEDGIEAKLFSSSGDFGKYSNRVLETFKEEIAKALSSIFADKKINLRIEISR